MRERLVVYTCVTAAYDDIMPPLIVEPAIDYVCFTDQPVDGLPVWVHASLPIDTGNAAANNRFVKMHPHLLFPDHEISVYIDGNIQPVGGIADLARSAMERGNIALYQHPLRDCIYAEAAACAEIGHDWPWHIAAQMRRYRRDGFPPKSGLFEANVIIRRHHAPEVRILMDAWWQAYRSGVPRDQLSLTYVAWKTGVKITSLGPSDPRGEQRHFVLKNTPRTRRPMRIRLRGWFIRKALVPILRVFHKDFTAMFLT